MHRGRTALIATLAVVLTGCGGGSSGPWIPQTRSAADIARSRGFDVCFTEIAYFGPDVGGQGYVAPGELVASYTVSSVDIEHSLSSRRTTRLRYQGRTAEKTHRFVTVRGDQENEVSVFAETEPTRVSLLGIEFEMFPEGSGIRFRMLAHPESKRELCSD